MLTAVVLYAATAGAGVARPPCDAGETALVVLVRERSLTLCDGGLPAARYPVALGAGGVGKRRAGDNKTPLGRYPLGRPRSSPGYDTFVPILYPTPEQQRRGQSGSAVGLHGPPRALSGPAVTAADWTAGCIAVGTDGEIRAIAAWVRRHGSAGVRIE
jgi:murein L,D-transpeptidase YafK